MLERLGMHLEAGGPHALDEHVPQLPVGGRSRVLGPSAAHPIMPSVAIPAGACAAVAVTASTTSTTAPSLPAFIEAFYQPSGGAAPDPLPPSRTQATDPEPRKPRQNQGFLVSGRQDLKPATARPPAGFPTFL